MDKKHRRSKLIMITPEEHGHFIRFIKGNGLTQRIVETYFKLPYGAFPNWKHSGIFQDQETKDRFLRLIDMNNDSEETMKDYNEILKLRDSDYVNTNENRSGETLVLTESDIEGAKNLLKKYRYYSKIPKRYGISATTYKFIVEGKKQEFRQCIVEKLRNALEEESREDSRTAESPEENEKISYHRSALLRITPEEHEHFISFLSRNGISVVCFEKYFGFPVHLMSNWRKAGIFTPEQKEIFLRAINEKDYPSFKEDVVKMKELQKSLDETKCSNHRGSSVYISDEDIGTLNEVIKKYGKVSQIPSKYGLSTATYSRMLSEKGRRVRESVLDKLRAMFTEELGEDYTPAEVKTDIEQASPVPSEEPKIVHDASSIWKPKNFREAVLTLKTRIEAGYSDIELKELMKEIVEGF